MPGPMGIAVRRWISGRWGSPCIPTTMRGFLLWMRPEYLIEIRAEKEELKYGENCPTWLRNV